jgi:hypothetical protein
MKSSFKTLVCGAASNDLSNDNIGRDPFKQLPDSFNSSIVCTRSVSPGSILLYLQFWTWSFAVGPFGAFANHRYKSCPRFLASNNNTLLQLYNSAKSFR